MKKSFKQLKKDLVLQQLKLIELDLRDLIKRTNQQHRAKLNKEFEELKTYIRDI